MEDLSEEMKIIIALAKHLGFEITATGNGRDQELVDSSIYTRTEVEYTYEIRPIRQ